MSRRFYDSSAEPNNPDGAARRPCPKKPKRGRSAKRLVPALHKSQPGEMTLRFPSVYETGLYSRRISGWIPGG